MNVVLKHLFFLGVEEQNIQRNYGEMAYEYTCDREWV